MSDLEKIDGLVDLSKKFRGYGTNASAEDSAMMLKLSALYLAEASDRSNNLKPCPNERAKELLKP